MAARGSALAVVAGLLVGSLALQADDVTREAPAPAPLVVALPAPVASDPPPAHARALPNVRRVSAQVLTRRHGAGRTITLTFDDGPDPVWTPKVLALLDQADVRAVFCMVGQQVREHPETARAVVRHGHGLCNHTTTHDLGLRDRTGPRMDLEIARTSNLVRQATGREPTWFRAPGGRFTPFLDRVAQLRGLQPLGWSDDPRDWSRPGWAAIVRRVLAEARPGRVVLLHDGGGDRAQTVRALRVLLRELPRRGYRFVLP